MLFPKVDRVIYRNNPLDTVVCQLQFPAILKIDTEVPASFQEKIRRDYPNLSVSTGWFLEPSAVVNMVPSQELKGLLQTPVIRNYEFSSDDGKWKVNLTRSFVSLSTNDYRRWEDFKDRLQSPIKALMEVYEPAHFARIGLRYVDVIVRSKLRLKNVNWSQLIRPELLGLLSLKELMERIYGLESTFDMKLDSPTSGVRVSVRIVRKVEDPEPCLMIDSDFSDSSTTSADGVIGKLDYLNSEASSLIRWAIKNRLHKAMEPEPL